MNLTSANSTLTIVPVNEITGIIFFLVGCFAMLITVIIIFFAKLEKTSMCFAFGKYIKIKIINLCCCCYGTKTQNRLLEENVNELNEVL